MHSNSIHNIFLMEFKINSSNKIINSLYQTALHLAIEKENIEIIKLLLATNKLDKNILVIIITIFIALSILYFYEIINILKNEKEKTEIIKYLLVYDYLNINELYI